MPDAMHFACPFCGSKDLVLQEDRTSLLTKFECYVRCRSCGGTGPWKERRDEAFAAWDMRHVSPSPTATIALDLGEN